MVDIVTPDNEAMFREAFCVTSGHSDKCVKETVELMAKVMGHVCVCKDLPINQILQNMEIEVFQHHLLAILKQKKCNCKNES